MKYDCGKTEDYLHERARMCRSMECVDCERDEGCSPEYTTVDDIEIVQKWSDSHPEQTRLEKFMKLIEGTEFDGEFKFNCRSLLGEQDEYQDSLTSKHNRVWWSEVSE